MASNSLRFCCFGIISIFGIEEHKQFKDVAILRFGIISIFGIEELTEEEALEILVLVSSQFLV